MSTGPDQTRKVTSLCFRSKKREPFKLSYTSSKSLSDTLSQKYPLLEHSALTSNPLTCREQALETPYMSKTLQEPEPTSASLKDSGKIADNPGPLQPDSP
ncbi:hypothetical protein JOB18_005558 [Solea senegalensis]|uniref:Uncharacterized protein n=1 Tax=Solea senegalensis TaxID=28829 RepID=A0AAV6SD93_SOLSE|nr:hypothetical protein JOB18_005558 [Solea senegalensis]